MNSKQVRQYNTARVFSAIFRAPGATQADIRAATLVDRSTISAVLARMEKDGIVRRLRSPGNGSGRPEDSFHLRGEAGLLVGMVVGRDEIRLAGAGLDGARKAEIAARFRAEDEASVASACAEAARQLVQRCGNLVTEIAGLGIAFPGPHPGVVDHWQPPGDERGRIAMRVGRLLGRPVSFGDESQAMALGEHRFGVGRDIESLIFVHLDRDVGSSIIMNQGLVYGAGDCGSQIGHVKVELNGHPCPCGGRGCLTRYVSAPALVARMAEFGRSIADMKVLEAAARADDKLAKTVILEAGSYLGLALANAGNAVGVADFVIAGEVARLADHLVPAVDDMLRRSLVPPLNSQRRVHRSLLRNDLALDGALALAMDAFMPIPSLDRA